MDVLRRLFGRQRTSTPRVSDHVRSLTEEQFSALIYDSEDEYGDVIEGLTEVLRADPSNANAYNNRGLAYAEIGMVRHALADLDRAVELDGGHTLARKNRATLLRDHGDQSRAIADLTVAIETDPNDLGAYASRAEAYRATGRDAEAVADLRRVEEIRTTDPRWIEIERLRLAAQRSGQPAEPVKFPDVE
jgi:tetratricopeptide (TPR) repeat protein